jgi:hypothetical protein
MIHVCTRNLNIKIVVAIISLSMLLLMHSCGLGRKFVAAIRASIVQLHSMCLNDVLNFHPDIIKLVSFACLHDKLFN